MQPEDYRKAPLRRCGSRNEGQSPVPGPDAGDLTLGPAYFESVVAFASETPSQFTPSGAHPFRACRAGEPAFGYIGTVGPWTQVGGGFIVAGPGCYPVELRVAGKRHREVLSFGAGPCG